MDDDQPPFKHLSAHDIQTLTPERFRLHGIILSLVVQSCSAKDDILDSSAISAYEAALLELADVGFVDLDNEAGRIMGRMTEAGEALLDLAAQM